MASIDGIECLGGCDVQATNHSYFPIMVRSEYPLNRDALYEKLKDNGISRRRYFYPLISDFSMYRGLPSAHPDNLPVARKAAQHVLCVPIYPNLTDGDVARVIETIRD